MDDENVIIKDENGKEIESYKKLPIAILFSLAGALIGLGVWVGLSAVGFYSAWAALAIAACANYFYDLGKGPKTKAKFWTVLGITIFILLLSEYLSLYIQLIVFNYTGVTFANTLSIVFSNFSVFAVDFILFIVFGVLGTASTLVQIYRQVNGVKKSKVKSTNFSDEANDDYEAKFKEFEENSKDKFDE